METKTICGQEYYCVYVGIAKGESLRKRINLHVKCSINNSTLRKSIAAIIGDTNKQAINDFLDPFYVETITYDEEKEEVTLPDYETTLINKKLRLLNIAKSDRDDAKEVKNELKRLRKILTESLENN